MSEARSLRRVDLPRILRGKVARARLALLWERLCPALWPLLAICTTFLVTALFGLWTHLPDWSRACGLVLFAGLALAALWPVARVRLPSLEQGLHRLETVSGVPHRPATAYMDPLANRAGPSESAALWQAHKIRVQAQLAALRAGFPRVSLIKHDPYVLRAALGLLLFVAVAFAGPDWRLRLVSPFLFGADAATFAASIDAWVTPPAYTGRPPLFLTGTGDDADADAHETVEVPAGSELIVRASGDGATLTLKSPLATRNEAGESIPPRENPAAGASREFRTKLTRSTIASLDENGRTLRNWRFAVSLDEAPVIVPDGAPEAAVSGALKLSYSVSDDYGVVSAEAALRKPGQARDAEEPLIEAPRFALTLPKARARNDRAETYKDLLAHPWAGAEVEAVLRARDEAGNIGESAPIAFALPQRTFSQPLARAVIEQRRILALSPSRRALVAQGLDALTLSPQDFITDTTVYLGLRAAYWRLRDATGRDGLVSTVDLLWDIALRIEDGDLSLAERNLRAAQEALEQALAENAGLEEIERLTEELRQALNDYLHALAQSARNNPQSAQQPVDQNQQVIRSQDLQRLLDNIENLARSGAREQAQQLLSQMRDILENLRNARPQQASPEQRQMSQSLEELADMINRQQRLMDDTFRLDSQGNRAGPQQNGSDPEAPHTGPLRQRQSDLQNQLQQLVERLKTLSSRANDALNQAGKEMGNAAKSLGQGDAGGAVPRQGEALENLRQGAESLAQELAESMQGSGSRNGEVRTDPLGRPQATRGPDLGTTVKVPDEIDTQRVRRILDELRRRLGERHRPRIELDYLERLLRPF